MRATSMLAILPTVLLLTVSPAVALAEEADTIQAIVTAGTLVTSVSVPAAMSGVTLGVGSQTSRGAAPAWKVVDARGTGAGWTLSASATNFVSEPGSSPGERDERVIEVGNLTITPGTVVGDDGADAAPHTSEIRMSLHSQALVSAPPGHTGAKGSFTVPSPVFTLDIPANSFRSNVGDDGVHPYRSTIVFTIA